MTILSRLYGHAAHLRRAWYEGRPHRVRRLAQPVISVGNLVAGGSGKTPVVATLARLLLERGDHPAILSRGYGRRRAGDDVVVVSDGREILEPTIRSGDEPQMLARALRRVPVVVASDRFLAGRMAEQRLGCTVHLLDDGFQHLHLARDINLLLMSPTDLQEPLLPSGRLREPLSAIHAADALLVAGGSDAVQAMRGLGVNAVFRLSPQYGDLRPVGPLGAPPPREPGRRIVAVAGIARPERFFSALRAQGWEVARTLVFRDHHWFTQHDVESIGRVAVEANADLVVTTEKDAMRLLPDDGPHGSAPQCPFAYLPMEMAIDPAAEFAAWLDGRLAAARERAPQEAA